MGALSKDYVFKMFKLDPALIESIFDFLVNEEEIIMEEIEAWSFITWTIEYILILNFYVYVQRSS